MTNQFKATVTHISHYSHRLVVEEHCPGETRLDLFVSFPRSFEKSLVLQLFKALNYLSSVGLSRRKQCN